MMYDNRGKRKTSACCAPPGQNKAQRSFTKYVPLINIKAQRIGGKTRGEILLVSRECVPATRWRYSCIYLLSCSLCFVALININ